MGLINKDFWPVGSWCIADISRVSPSSEQNSLSSNVTFNEDLNY